jgi:hypothetical protein
VSGKAIPVEMKNQVNIEKFEYLFIKIFDKTKVPQSKVKQNKSHKYFTFLKNIDRIAIPMEN